MIVADSMLGRLARYLRLIGYEVEYVTNDKDDSYIISISENNLILTRDRRLHEKIRNSVLIKSYSSIDQLRELRGKLHAPEHGFMEVCSVCGRHLDRAGKDEVLPEYVNKEAEEIFYCKNCDKYYWNGSHTANFRRMVEGIGIEIH